MRSSTIMLITATLLSIAISLLCKAGYCITMVKIAWIPCICNFAGLSAPGSRSRCAAAMHARCVLHASLYTSPYPLICSNFPSRIL